MTSKFVKTLAPTNLDRRCTTGKGPADRHIKYSIPNSEMVTPQKNLKGLKTQAGISEKRTQMANEQTRGSPTSLIQSSSASYNRNVTWLQSQRMKHPWNIKEQNGEELNLCTALGQSTSISGLGDFTTSAQVQSSSSSPRMSRNTARCDQRHIWARTHRKAMGQ